jgi:hypothetical protein
MPTTKEEEQKDKKKMRKIKAKRKENRPLLFQKDMMHHLKQTGNLDFVKRGGLVQISCRLLWQLFLDQETRGQDT